MPGDVSRSGRTRDVSQRVTGLKTAPGSRFPQRCLRPEFIVDNMWTSLIQSRRFSPAIGGILQPACPIPAGPPGEWEYCSRVAV